MDISSSWVCRCRLIGSFADKQSTIGALRFMAKLVSWKNMEQSGVSISSAGSYFIRVNATCG